MPATNVYRAITFPGLLLQWSSLQSSAFHFLCRFHFFAGIIFLCHSMTSTPATTKMIVDGGALLTSSVDWSSPLSSQLLTTKKTSILPWPRSASFSFSCKQWWNRLRHRRPTSLSYASCCPWLLSRILVAPTLLGHELLQEKLSSSQPSPWPLVLWSGRMLSSRSGSKSQNPNQAMVCLH